MSEVRYFFKPERDDSAIIYDGSMVGAIYSEASSLGLNWSKSVRGTVVYVNDYYAGVEFEEPKNAQIESLWLEEKTKIFRDEAKGWVIPTRCLKLVR